MTSKLAIFCCVTTLIYSVIQVQCLHGGQDAEPGQYPYYAGLNVDHRGNQVTFCGGAILNNQWILTAAGCITDIDSIGEILIKAGNVYMSKRSETEQVSIIDKSFVPDGELGDIALLKLVDPFVFNDYVKPIGLPETRVLPRGEGTVVGFGSLGPYSYQKLPSVLQTLTLSVIDYNECMNYAAKVFDLGPVPPSYYDTLFCTAPTKENQGNCMGDRGDPLVTKVEDKNVLVGVANGLFLTDCSAPGLPSGYTKVSAFTRWIQDTIKAN